VDSTIVSPSAAPCSFSLAYGAQAFPASGGSGTIGVSTSSGCAWSVASAPSWVTIGGAPFGVGSGTVAFQVAANSGPARSAGIPVAGLTFTVDQTTASASFSSVGSIAQIAAFSGWNSTVTLLNTSSTASEVIVNFIGDDGTPLALPVFVSGGSSSAPELAAAVDRTIQPGAQLTIRTAGDNSQPAAEGWAQVLAKGGGIGGSAIFAWTASQTQEAVAPLENRTPTAFVLPFDYTGAYATGVAVANLSNQAASIPVVLRDASGASLGTAAISLAPYGHTAFMLATAYPAVTGKTGSLELDVPAGGQISALGIRAAPGGAITSVPVVAK
jgi:hypothetical protein